MKHIMLNLSSRQIYAFTLLCVVSLVIWFFSPFLFVANIHPFSQIEKRIYFITLIWIAWILKLFFSSSNTSSSKPTNPEDTQKLHVLQKRFDGAIKFLKKTIINKQSRKINLSQLPWYLLIGPSHAGKTSLLAKSGIHFILAKQFKQEKISPSETCDWWATRDWVMIDVPGVYLSAKENFLWDHFLRFLKKSSKATLSTIVIALPLPELIKNPKRKKILLSQIKSKISQLQEKFPDQLNFYFVITKCDLIPGFSDFFSECGTDELAQPWGITLPTLKENKNLVETFNHRFNNLIQRLNKQLIWRLHQERNLASRSQIKDFPLQLERLKHTLAEYLKILSPYALRLHGIYMTSAVQFPTEDTTPHTQMISPHAQQTLQLLRHPAMPSKAFFIRQLLLQALLSNADPFTVVPPDPVWRQRLAYATSITLVITAAILLGSDFQHSVLETYAIQNNLAQYQLTLRQSNEAGEHLIKALPLLDKLHALAHPKNHRLSSLAFYSNKSQTTATVVYQQTLQTIIFPEIKKYFEHYLQAANEKSATQLYSILKAYLMLGDPKEFQTEFLAKTINQLTPSKFDSKNSADLAAHISIALHQKQNKMSLDSQLIANVRKQLTDLPKEELAFIILQNMNDNNSDNALDLGTHLGNPSVFVSKDIIHKIPNMFTATAFSAVITNGIPLAATEALQGNFVIGNFEILSNEATINVLAEQLHARYIENYVDIWESLLANLKLVMPNDLTQMDAMLITLTGDTSPLLQILQTIKQNTAFEPVISASPKFQALTNLLANASNNSQDNPLYQIFASLRQLHSYLQAILASPTPDKAVFEAAKQRMQHAENDPITQLRLLAEKDSEPMKSWLNNLAKQSWNFILQDAAQYINDIWQTNVFSVYNGQIANRFPFNPAGKEQINPQQFADFIGQQGALAIFYSAFLKPFTMDSGKAWQWRVVDNQKLPFSDTALEKLQEFSKLQNAFSTHNKNLSSLAHFQQYKLPEQLVE